MRAFQRLTLVAGWNVRACRIGAEHVAALRQGTGTRAAADLAVLTDAALSGECVFVAQRTEHRVIAVNIQRVAVSDVAARHRQKSAREYLSEVGDEHEAPPLVDPTRDPTPSGLISLLLLEKHASQMRRGGGL